MTDYNESYKENVPGRYYVAKVCIGCTLCAEIAPENFRENLHHEYYAGLCYVCKQPVDVDEESLCEEAMESCPANAIRSDGAEQACQMPRRRRRP